MMKYIIVGIIVLSILLTILILISSLFRFLSKNPNYLADLSLKGFGCYFRILLSDKDKIEENTTPTKKEKIINFRPN